MDRSFTVLKTPLGALEIGWGERGITSIRLSGSPEGPRAAPPEPVRRAMRTIREHLEGKLRDLSSVPLDLEGVPPFHRRVYQAARAIGPGSTVTYRELAARAGSPGAARAVGQAMARNPFLLVVPCHRVLGAGNDLVGFSAPGGCDTKARLLAFEGAQPGPPPAASRPSLFDGSGRLVFDIRTATRKLSRADPILGRLIRRVGPFSLKPEALSSPFKALAEAIVYQQLTGRAAATIFSRVARLSPGRRFPRPQDIISLPEGALRAAGLSRAKAAALRDLSAKAIDGTLPSLREMRRMDDEDIESRLVEIRGVGRWTAEMLLIFRLGRPDVLPVHDYGIRKAFALTFRTRGLPTPAQVALRGERWRPFRTIASWYLWRALD